MLKVNVGALQQLKALSQPYARDPNKPLSARRAAHAGLFAHPKAPRGLKIGDDYWLIRDETSEWPITNDEFRFAYTQGPKDQPAASEGPVFRVGWTAMLRLDESFEVQSPEGLERGDPGDFLAFGVADTAWVVSAEAAERDYEPLARPAGRRRRIFFSYKKDDAEVESSGYGLLENIYEMLSDEGYDVFWDREDMRSGAWRHQLARHIANADAVLLFLGMKFVVRPASFVRRHEVPWIMRAHETWGVSVRPILLPGVSTQEAQSVSIRYGESHTFRPAANNWVATELPGDQGSFALQAGVLSSIGRDAGSRDSKVASQSSLDEILAGCRTAAAPQGGRPATTPDPLVATRSLPSGNRRLWFADAQSPQGMEVPGASAEFDAELVPSDDGTIGFVRSRGEASLFDVVEGVRGRTVRWWPVGCSRRVGRAIDGRRVVGVRRVGRTVLLDASDRSMAFDSEGRLGTDPAFSGPSPGRFWVAVRGDGRLDGVGPVRDALETVSDKWTTLDSWTSIEATDGSRVRWTVHAAARDIDAGSNLVAVVSSCADGDPEVIEMRSGSLDRMVERIAIARGGTHDKVQIVCEDGAGKAWWLPASSLRLQGEV